MARRAIPRAEQLQEEAQHLFDAINSEQPLACALIVGAAVERACIGLVGKFLVNCTNAANMLGENGPLGGFAVCARMAYCLGLISNGARANCEQIGLIRNAFAHSNVPLNFDDDYVAGLCNGLTFPRVHQHIVVGGGGPTPFHEIATTPRSRFSVIGVLTFNYLMFGIMQTEHRERCVDYWDQEN